MTTIIDGSNGITFPNSTVQASAGSVLQVVNATYSTQVSTTTNTYIDTGLTATITPKFSTSKILALVNLSGCAKDTVNTNNSFSTRLLRNGTNISLFNVQVGYTGTNIWNIIGSSSTTVLDSPATTSATTYKVQINNFGNAGTVYAQLNGDVSSITLMEIAG